MYIAPAVHSSHAGVGMSVKSHLTSGASVRPENNVTYSKSNENQKICEKPLHCRDIPLPARTASKGPNVRLNHDSLVSVSSY